MANVSKKYNLKIIKRKKKDKQITQKNRYVNKGQKQKKIKMLINTCAMNNQNNLKKKKKMLQNDYWVTCKKNTFDIYQQIKVRKHLERVERGHFLSKNFVNFGKVLAVI